MVSLHSQMVLLEESLCSQPHTSQEMNLKHCVPCGSGGREPTCSEEMQVPSLGREDPLEKGMAPHSSILAWEIPWPEQPGGLQSVGSRRVGRDRVTEQPLRDGASHPRPLRPRPRVHRGCVGKHSAVLTGAGAASALGKCLLRPQTTDEQRGEALGVQRGTRLLLLRRWQGPRSREPSASSVPAQKGRSFPAVGPQSRLSPERAAVGPLPALRTTDHTDTP